MMGHDLAVVQRHRQAKRERESKRARERERERRSTREPAIGQAMERMLNEAARLAAYRAP